MVAMKYEEDLNVFSARFFLPTVGCKSANSDDYCCCLRSEFSTIQHWCSLPIIDA